MGVKPIDVSIGLPLLKAVIEQPPPRCIEIKLIYLNLYLIFLAVCSAAYLCEIP